MAQGMWQKIEITGLSVGLLSVSVLLIEIFFWKYIPDEVHQYFYGGEPGAFVTGMLIVVGLLSSVLFIFNLFFKRFYLWWLRLLGVIALFFGIAVIGASGI
jgi:ABC-type multidrug transport system permease subunit